MRDTMGGMGGGVIGGGGGGIWVCGVGQHLDRGATRGKLQDCWLEKW